MSYQPNQEKVFSCGLELAGVVLTSDLPQRSLQAIQNLKDDPAKKNIRAPSSPFSLAYKAYDDDENKCKIIAFGCEFERVSSVLSPTWEQCPPEFNFLQTIGNTFSVNEEALALFRSLHLPDPDLFQEWKNPSRPLIVTGHSLGGWVASLFCVWLLENINKKTSNIPICITFGSPLLGDDGLHKAIHNHPGWNPRFLHVVCDGDLIPRSFLSSTTTNNKNTYKPFGTFLMCSQSGSACFDDPDSVLSLLAATGWSQVPSLMDYKKLLEDLTHQMIVSKGAGALQLDKLRGNPLRAGIILQLDAIGDKRMREDNKEDNLITDIEKRERLNYQEHKKRISEAEKKLNGMKMNMANLEWYKKISSSPEVPIGYYDCYKSKPFPRDIHAVKFKKHLTKYWEDVVDEAQRKPRKQGDAAMATRLLFGGTNYRRMVEPLHIADYYKAGKRNYCTEGRPKHFKLLQAWQEEQQIFVEHKKGANTREKAATLTEDSCFWANVEEALILNKSLKNGEPVGGPEESPVEKLKKFEDYVMGLINNLAVSPEIFLKESTFMQWWNEYEKIPERTHRSSLANFMECKSYQKYI